MTKSTLTSPLKNVISTGICPIITDLEDLRALDAHPGEVAKALSKNGIHTLEIANRGMEFMDLIEQVSEPLAHHGICMGVGTVTTAQQAQRANQIGAKFVVSPHFDEGVSYACRKSGLLYIPGVETATEFVRAYRKGWHTVKFFPAISPWKLQQIRGALALSCPELSVIASGMEKSKDKRVLHKELEQWYLAGADSIVYRSELFGGAVLQKSEWKQLAANARQLVQEVVHLREKI